MEYTDILNEVERQQGLVYAGASPLKRRAAAEFYRRVTRIKERDYLLKRIDCEDSMDVDALNTLDDQYDEFCTAFARGIANIINH